MEENMEEKMQEVKKEYKCKYCGEVFEKPLLLAHHVRLSHKKLKKKEKKGIAVGKLAENIRKNVEAVGILKGLQVSPSLSEAEKEVLDDVAKRIEGLLTHIQKGK